MYLVSATLYPLSCGEDFVASYHTGTGEVCVDHFFRARCVFGLSWRELCLEKFSVWLQILAMMYYIWYHFSILLMPFLYSKPDERILR